MATHSSVLVWRIPGMAEPAGLPLWGRRTRLPMQEAQEIQVCSLSWEDALKTKMATHSSILAWRIPCIDEHGRLQSMGSQRVGHD